MYLMLEDTEVLYFDLEDLITEEIKPDLMPFAMRGVLRKVENSHRAEDQVQAILYNTDCIKRWMSSRVLSLHRDNAKKILTALKLPQSNLPAERIKMCLACNGLSVTDSYWIRKENEPYTWESVNLFHNKFSEMTDVALYGKDPKNNINPRNPELTSKGMFCKAWVRDPDQDVLWLLKSDKHACHIHSVCEVLASKILSCFYGIENVKYTGRIKIGDILVPVKTLYVTVLLLSMHTACRSFARTTD